MTYALFTGLKRRAVKAGDTFNDTVIDLTSGQACVTSVICKESPSLNNGSRWVFSTVDNLTERDERWELDTNGATMYQEMWPFVARRKNGAVEETGQKRAPALFETLAIPVSRGAADDESIGLTLDSAMAPDSSVGRYYRKSGKNWVLGEVSAGCPGKQSASPADACMREFTAPTATMQSADVRIVKIADSLVKGKTDRCDSIRACFEYVYRLLTKKYSPTFSNALETLAAGFGDCGEHAVLLGALLRAELIPARVMLGLVYVDSRKSYLYHAWVAAYAGGGAWVFVDPALGVFPATRDRVPLIIDDTGAAVIGIAKMMGRIKIDYVKK